MGPHLASTGETASAARAVGRMSADTLASYPPGIPNALPGELINTDLVDFLRGAVAAPHGHVRGAADPTVRTLRVVATHDSASA